MAHHYETRTIDYTQEHPPEWATPEEKVNFYPIRAAKLICAEIGRAEDQMDALKDKETEAEEAP